MQNKSALANEILLRPYNSASGDDTWINHWNQQKQIQEISDENSLLNTSFDDEILEVNSMFMIEHKADVIGCVSCMYNSDRSSVTMGIMIGEPEKRNLGYGSIALGKAIGILQHSQALRRLHAYVYHDNLPAIKMFEKFQFKSAGQVLFKRKITLHFILDIR